MTARLTLVPPADLASVIPPCGHWLTATQTWCGTTPARLYLPGPRCETHTPAQVAGRTEPPDLPPPPRVRTTEAGDAG